MPTPTTADDLDALRRTHPRLALYVTRPGCGPCTAAWPQVEATFGADPGWALVRVDAEAAPAVAGQLLVFSVPALMLFLDGHEVWRAARVLRRGAVRQAKAQVDAAVAVQAPSQSAK